MAMQAVAPAVVIPSAQVVGNAFVDQYYHILHHSPELVHKFYQDSSILSRPDSNGIMTSVTTMQGINEKIQSLDYKNYRAEITTADAQHSYQAGVIVLVTGYLTSNNNLRRKFTQTFFLAPQEKGYFVLNDIFRYVEENEVIGKAPVTFTSGNAAVPATSNPEPPQIPVQSTLQPATASEQEDLQSGAEVCDPSDIEEGSIPEEEVVDEPPTQSSQNETVAIVNSNPPAAHEEKKSYASIVKVTKPKVHSSSVSIVTSSTWVAPAKSNKQSPDSEKSNAKQETSADSSNTGPESSNSVQEGFSIYVRNLPLNSTATQLEEVFKSFGPIKHEGIQVRSNKQQGFCFGFVEFETLEGMQKAIEASSVAIGGRQAMIEEKRTPTRIESGGRGRYISGRDGYRSDNFRNRTSYGGRGYGKNEARNQGDQSSKAMGSGGRGMMYQRVKDQQGSRRYVRQGVTQKADNSA